MRHQYTPIFRDLLDSSLWASAAPAIRCVWIAFLLDADPEGCIPTSVPGLARRANVTVEEARAAIALLEAPDPDSRTPDFEGRRVAKVPGGWQVLNFVAKRELAKHEAEKARKRKWANENGKRPPVANDNAATLASNLDASSETLDAPKPKPKPKDLSSEGEISPLPLSDAEAVDPERMERWREAPPETPGPRWADTGTQPAVLRELPDDWQPSDDLRAKAAIAGVKNLDHWIAKLRLIRIGGQNGVLAHKLDAWVESQLGTWRTWEETERAKAANSQAAPGAAKRFAVEAGYPAQPERKRVQGAPAWVYVDHATFAGNQGIDVARAAKAFARQSRVAPENVAAADSFQPFMEFLRNLAEQRAREASA